MGVLQDMIRRWKGNREEPEDIDDDETKDRYLRSLRRERRIQMEEVEKEQLKKDIEAFKKARARKHLWGVKEDIKEKQRDQLIQALKKKKKVNLMHNGYSILKEKKGKIKDSASWMGKSGL